MQKSRVLVSALLVGIINSVAFANLKVIYGEDNRQDLFAATNSEYIKLAESTAAMVPRNRLKESGAYEVVLGGRTLSERGMCKSERFANQPTTANCSGFLVGKDTVVTAGHCIKSQSDCSSNSWVFDYKVDYDDQSEVTVDKSNVYKCKSIIKTVLENGTQNDYAYIKLDREVEGREALKFRTEGKPQVGDEILVIGHPTGLPSKITDGAVVRSVGEVFFTTNLDTYGGNSGSAVFNATTGVVEGILVRGATDYVYDSSQGCQVSNVLGSTAGRGEDVTLITNIKELMEAGSGDEDEVEPAPPRVRLPRWLRRLLGLE